MDPLPLFIKYPGTQNIPRIELINHPTPVERLTKTADKLGVSELWIKRDDLTNEEYGGNKPRKYEFLLGKAFRKKKTEIITIGGVGSNHALANTIFAKKFGVSSRVYLIDQPLLDIVRDNMLCDLHFGAKMIYCRNELTLALKILGRMMVHWKSFLVMPGGSVPTGTIGFVNAALELADQVKKGEIPEPDHLFVALGSAGTTAGLLLGLELAGLKTKLHAVRVAAELFTGERRVVSLAKGTLKLLRKYDKTIPDVSKLLNQRLIIHGDFFGGEYGRMTTEGLDAINLIKEDGVKLDTTYTGKAFSALINHCQCCEEDEKCEVILYWNTKNSRDLSKICQNEDYHNLPSSLHKFFDGTVPDHTHPVNAKAEFQKKE